MMARDHVQRLFGIGALLVFAAAIRRAFFNDVSADMVNYVIPWYDFLQTHGFREAFSQNFSDYAPAYLYLLWFFTRLKFIPNLFAIKLISIFFDFMAAFVVYRIVIELTHSQNKAWVGFFGVLLTPVTVLESGVWGQCDMVFSFFIVAMICYLIKDKMLPAVISFSVALSFKLQAIFILPLLVLLFLRRKIPWYWSGIPILVYLLSILPAWVSGRPLWDLLTIYTSQIDNYPALSLNAANLWIFLSKPEEYSFVWVLSGVVLAGLVVLAYLVFRWKISKNLDPKSIVFDAVFFTLVIPYLLPKMHERYFFPACVLIILYACLDRKAILPAVLLQLTTGLSFLPYLFNASKGFVMAGAILNLMVISWFILMDVTRRQERIEPGPERLLAGQAGN